MLGTGQTGRGSHDPLRMSHDLSEGELQDTAIGVRNDQNTVPSGRGGIVRSTNVIKKESSIQGI